MEQEAPPSAGLYNFLGWLDTNKQRVAMGVVALFFVGAIIGFFVWRSGQKEIDAEEALSSVRMPFGPSQQAEPGTAEALLKVAEEYPNTKAAPKASLRAATVFFDQGNFAKAQEQFDKYLRSYGETPWVPSAVYGIAASLDAQGKSAEAIAKYTNFVATYANDPAADQARMNLARLYEQTGQPTLALDVLNKMTSAQQGGYNPVAAEAQERIKELYAKHPALRPAMPVDPSTFTPSMLTNFVRSTNMAQLTNAVRRTNSLLNLTNTAPRILPSPGATNQTK